MVVEDTDNNSKEFGATVRAFAFDGEESKFRTWEGKTLALAGSKGFSLALTRASTGRVLTVEEFEYGEVEEAAAVPTGTGAAPAAVQAPTMRATTVAENRRYQARAQAWSYLVASCSGKAYAIIESCNGDPYAAWTILQAKYCATDAEENYPELSSAFNACKLTETKKDPELWFNDLDHLNTRIGKINPSYKKDDLQLKSHIMASMSSGYDTVIVKYRGDLAETSLDKIKREIVMQYKTLKKSTTSKSESALNASVTKHYKKFKGTCSNCGKIGHKADVCRSGKVDSTKDDTKKAGGNLEKVKCWRCDEKGHYANKCPKKPSTTEKSKEEQMAMFVGLAGIECAVDTHTEPQYEFVEAATCIVETKTSKDSWEFVGNATDTSATIVEEANTDEHYGVPDGFFDNWTENVFSDTGTESVEDKTFINFFEIATMTTATVDKLDAKPDKAMELNSIESVHKSVPPYDADTIETIDDYNGTIVYDGGADETVDTGAMYGDESVSMATGDTSEAWLLDSGATCGVTYDNSLMTDIRASTRQITIANGGKIDTLSQGTITLQGNNGTNVTMCDVYYAPKFTKNIVSLRKMLDDDWKLTTADKSEFVLKARDSEDSICFTRDENDQLYYLHANRVADESVNSLTNGPTVTLDINVAHGILGHPDMRCVRAMAMTQGWTLTGTVHPCGSCALAKARAKAVPKTTLTKAKMPGERLFLDISGPYSDSLNQNKYWLRIVDDHTRFCWDCFLPRKSGIQQPLEKLLIANKAAGKPCKFLRCDNAGENESYVQQLCSEHDVTLEMTAPNTPQMNGVVERSFATCKARAFATMYCARMTLESQALLWPEAVNTVTKLSNSLPRLGGGLDPYTAWHGKDCKANKILTCLQPFGRTAYVTDRKALKAKMDSKATKCVFVGYSADHSGDTYKFYNPTTKQTILSRDVHQWMEWHGRITATDDLALFEQIDKIKQDSTILPATAEDSDVPIVSDDEMPDDIIQAPRGAGPTEAAPSTTPTSVPRRARRDLTGDYETSEATQGAMTRARTRASTNRQVTVNVRSPSAVDTSAILAWIHHDEDRAIDEMVMNVLLQSDPQQGVPKNYKEFKQMNDPSWNSSLNGELENFLKRDAWEFIPRKQLPSNRKTLRSRWIFKKKADNTKKSRNVIRGYEQEPGVDYTESFSPLATNTTIKVALARALSKMSIPHLDWIIDLIDVEAAFLNAKVDSDIYIEMPEGLKEYLLTKGIDHGDSVIKLKRAQYGLVQSPRLWMETFAKILTALGMKQCKSDSCLFVLHDDDNNLVLIVVVYCDDCIVTGLRPYVNKIKTGIAKTVKISDLGKLKRHLGVDYEFGSDNNGPFVRCHMTDYLDAIVRDFENDTAQTIKERKIPGAAVTPPLRSTEDDEIIMQDLFRSYVGRVMFACGKSEPTISNACRELTSHLNAPNKEHVTALEHLIGFVKNGQYQGLKMRAPRDNTVVAFVDSDYASDRSDRKSISGYLITIGGCLVSWQSKKQTGVTLSSTEAEFVSMSMAATEVKFIVSLLTEIDGHQPLLPSILKEDNTGAIFMAKNTAIGQRTKHVDIRYRFVNDMILSNDLLVQHIRSGDNPSDLMTKNLPTTLFCKHAENICCGMLGTLYEPQNTEDVKSYCATVQVLNSAASDTVPVPHCDSVIDVCSEVAADRDSEWISVASKRSKSNRTIKGRALST